MGCAPLWHRSKRVHQFIVGHEWQQLIDCLDLVCPFLYLSTLPKFLHYFHASVLSLSSFPISSLFLSLIPCFYIFIPTSFFADSFSLSSQLLHILFCFQLFFPQCTALLIIFFLDLLSLNVVFILYFLLLFLFLLGNLSLHVCTFLPVQSSSSDFPSWWWHYSNDQRV